MMPRAPPKRALFLGLVAMTSAALIFFFYDPDHFLRMYSGSPSGHDNFKLRLEKPLQPHSFCQRPNVTEKQQLRPVLPDLVRNNPKKTKSNVLVVVESSSTSSLVARLLEVLTVSRIKFKVANARKNLPDLTAIEKGRGKFSVIVFEDFKSYLAMDNWNREILDKYCTTFEVGIMAFLSHPKSDLEDDGGSLQQVFDNLRHLELPFKVKTRRSLENFHLSGSASFLRIARGGRSYQELLPEAEYPWVTFSLPADHDENGSYTPVVWASRDPTERNGTLSEKEITVLQDHGKLDGVKKVIFGVRYVKRRREVPLHWMQSLVLLDTLAWLSSGRVVSPNQALFRYLMIDIDDVFVGGVRFTPADVDFLRESQKRISRSVSGFRYNLGFSGRLFQTGTSEENQADEMLIEHRDEFWWFPHEWQHVQSHLIATTEEMERRMALNRAFAEEHKINFTTGYAVSSHHSGAYPVHEPLFNAWRNVWNIEVTSTEEYPHLYPPSKRRGFVHPNTNIKVLPRQTCGLFTGHTLYRGYPEGPEKLERLILGGEVFQTILFNPVSVFMTHMPNYCVDRLAPYLFESVISMLNCWTNLELRTLEPKKLAQLYFDLFPEEKDPVWGNPCLDPKHMKILPPGVKCESLPEFLAVGPQKTGTAALYEFLKIHPSIDSNLMSDKTFEEPQFFSDWKNYKQGISWYMNFFPAKVDQGLADKGPSRLRFEKSATYFDHELAPLRAHSLLPEAKIIITLIPAAARAYSWYQHALAHDPNAAMNYSFHEVVTANSSVHSAVKSLQSRCLEPGKYHSHIMRWLSFYSRQQVLIVDGEELKHDPVSVMNRISNFLDVHPSIDYSDRLAYSQKKGFYCKVTENGKQKCLGKGKGRHYPSMEPSTLKYLQNFYRRYNENLAKLLKKLGYTVPQWLSEDLRL